MVIKAVIFDFDGTIADTYQAIFNITNSLASEFGYKSLSQEEVSFLKNLSSREIIKQSEISLFKLPFLVKRVQRELGKQIQELIPISGMTQVLQQLKHEGYIIGIVTSNIEDNVTAFLQKNELDNYFDFINSGTTIFGKHRIINKLIKKHHLSNKEVIYVGDETRDIRSARKSDVGIIAVGWGFNSVKALRNHDPDYLVLKPKQLLEVIKTWNKPKFTVVSTKKIHQSPISKSHSSSAFNIT